MTLIEMASTVVIAVAAAMLVASYGSLCTSWDRVPKALRQRWATLTGLAAAFFIVYAALEISLSNDVVIPVRFVSATVCFGGTLFLWLIARLARATLTHVHDLEEDFQDLFENANDLVQTMTPEGRLIWANRAWRTRMGFAVDEIAGVSFADLVPMDNRRQVSRSLDQARAGQSVRFETELLPRDGKQLLVEGSVSWRLRGGVPVAARCVFRDVTDQRQAEHQIRRLAYFDGLTGLPNRAMSNELLRHAVGSAARYGRRMALLFLDLDAFKRINDTLGHAAGDELLRLAAERLASCVRQGDWVTRGASANSGNGAVSRLGGDEFVIMLPDLREAEDAARVARRLLDAITAPFELNGGEVFVTASVGIAVFPDDGVDVECLLRNADVAMYHAKEQGKNRFAFFEASMTAQALQRLTTEAALHRALERNELELHYQPRFDVATRAITGVEALVRWNHPERGTIPTAEFIPLAEECGLIVPIGEWVLRTACAQASRWRAAGQSTLTMAVNVSCRQLSHSGIRESVSRALRDSGLEAEGLVIEVTESALAGDAARTMDLVQSWHRQGISIALDDFGTGCSSLARLRDMPIDYLKVDGSFVARLPEPSNAAIVRTVIELAHNLGVSSVAEGVETEAQMGFLRDVGCNECHGSLLARPLAAREMAVLLEMHAAQPAAAMVRAVAVS